MFQSYQFNPVPAERDYYGRFRYKECCVCKICKVTATQLVLLESTNFNAESAHVIPTFHLVAAE